MTTKKMICIHVEVSLALLGMLKVLTLSAIIANIL